MNFNSKNPHPVLMVCPWCRNHEHGLLDPNCPVCSGLGKLELGAAAAFFYPAPTVAEAIMFSLRRCEKALPEDTTAEDRTDAIMAHVMMLHEAGLIGNRADGLHAAPRH